jgi:hypothetical protein
MNKPPPSAERYFELLPDIFGNGGADIVQPLPERVYFCIGKMVDPNQLPPVLEFTTSSSAKNPPRGLLGIQVPVMSDAFIAALTECGVSNLQVFPATLKSRVDGTTWTDYKAVNVVGLVFCADLARSTYQKLMAVPGAGNPPVLSISELKIDASKAKGALMFRLGETGTTLMLNGKVVDKLLAMRSDDDWGISVFDKS